MGVNSLIILPDDVRVKDVAEVIGILAGLKPEWETSGNAKWVKVPGAEVKGHVDIPEMASITIKAIKGQRLIDGEESHYTTYHYEPDSSNEQGRLVYPRATAFWIACGLRLAQFFGGSICYDDCGDYKPHEKFKKTRKNNPSGGDEWDKFQLAMFNIKPLTKAELNSAREHAAYK